MMAVIKSMYHWLSNAINKGFIVFILLNIIIGVLYYVKDRYFRDAFKPAFLAENTQKASLNGVPLKPHYPDLSEVQILRLLGETWTRPSEYEPNTGYREPPFSGEFVNISEHGFRFSREQAPWPPRSDAPSVFFFGASTAFGYGLKDDQTVPSWFSALARQQPGLEKIQVYNFGRGAYNSTLERILFEKLIVSGHVPTYAVFVDGYADSFLLSHTPRLTRQITQFIQKLNQGFFVEESASWGKIITHTVKKLPIYRAMTSLKVRLSNNGGQNEDSQAEAKSQNISSKSPAAASEFERQLLDVDNISQAISRYRTNVRLTKSISKEFGVTAIFVWQPVPFYKFDLQFHPFAGTTNAKERINYVYSEMDVRHKNELSQSANFIWCADIQQNFHEFLYVDFAHYNNKGASVLANCIFEGMLPLLAKKETK